MLDKQRLRTFILGGLTGVLAGILLAPKSGKETRGDIADAVGETREKNRERYFDTRESVHERFSANRDGTARRREPRAHEPREEVVAPRYEAPSAGSGGEVRERPVLRDVSRDTSDETPGEESASREESVSRSEELRRKVRETRERIRSGTPPEENREDEK